MKKADYNRIKVALAEKRMTNKALARQLKVKPETVSRWCTNDSQPSIVTLYEIAKVLNVKASSLLTE